MKQLVLLFAGIISLAPVAASADDSAHDCGKDPNPVVNGASVTMKFVGACDKVAINGSAGTFTIESAKVVAINGASNTVDIAAAGKISVTGASNQVTYKKGLTGAKPKVSTTGVGNKVSQVK